MAFLAALPELAEVAGVGAEAGAAGGEAAAAGEAGGGLSGIESDFNDQPVGKTLGSRFGSAVKNDLAYHGVKSMLGGHQQQGGGTAGGPPTGGVDIGPMGNV